MNRCLLEFTSLEKMKDFLSFTNKDLRTLINQKSLIIDGKSFKLLPLLNLVVLSEEELTN